MEKFYICKNKNGDVSDAGNYVVVLILLQLSSPNCLNITFCPASYHLWPQHTAS